MIGHITTLGPVRAGPFDASANWAGRTVVQPGRRRPETLGYPIQGPRGEGRPEGQGKRRLHPHQYGIDSDVTNLCKDEIYLLSPNTAGLFVLAGC